ncbi:hypothetical protein ACLOJK_005787 [Asimina triloba]
MTPSPTADTYKNPKKIILEIFIQVIQIRSVQRRGFGMKKQTRNCKAFDLGWRAGDKMEKGDARLFVWFLIQQTEGRTGNSRHRQQRRIRADKLQLSQPAHVVSEEIVFSRRRVALCGGASLIAILSPGHGLSPLAAKAEESNQKESENEADKGIVDTIKSLLDPNETTKTGKVLPKAYLKSAREVVKTLRESLKEDAKDIAKFRRTADAAKESIKEYLSDWKGQQKVVMEESYVALEKAIRELAGFYSKAGPFAALPEDVKSSILDYLNTAEAFL